MGGVCVEWRECPRSDAGSEKGDPKAAPPQYDLVVRPLKRSAKLSNRHILRGSPTFIFVRLGFQRGCGLVRTRELAAKAAVGIATSLVTACSAIAACLEGLLRRHPGQGAKLVGKRARDGEVTTCVR